MKKLGKWLCLVLVVVFSFTLFACAPKTLTKGIEKMNNAGYKVRAMSTDEIVDDIFEGINIGAIAAIECEREITGDALLAIWFWEEEQARDFEAIFNLSSRTYIAEIIPPADMTIEYDSAGKIFYFGTGQACKDFID